MILFADYIAGVRFLEIGAIVSTLQMTIDQIAIEHYLPEKRRRRRTNTVDGYESSIRLYVLPAWGAMTVSGRSFAGPSISGGSTLRIPRAASSCPASPSTAARR